MNILISNDDGIDAPGIRALERWAEGLGNPIVFAPRVQHSGCGHQVTVDRPISINQVAGNRYAVDGTPADCVRIALTQFDFDFQWMLSGINSGGNLGVDVYMSGTAAAAREASWFGLQSFAISQYRSRDFVEDWERSVVLASRGIDFVKHRKEVGPGFWNINLPCISEVSDAGHEIPVRICKLDTRPHQVRYREEDEGFVYSGSYQDRPRDQATDVELCFGGAVSVTRCP